MRVISLLAASLLLVTTSQLAADESDDNRTDTDEQSLDEIALELAHPLGRWITLRNDFEYRSYQGDLPGAGNQGAGRYVLEASWPFELSNGHLITARLNVPINWDQPVYREYDNEYTEWMIRQAANHLDGSGEFITGHDHLEDVSLRLDYGGISQSGWLGMAGLVATFPTNQDFSGAREQYLLGGEFAVGKISDWGVLGATTSHVVDIKTEEGTHTSLTSIQVFFAWTLGNGWQVISNPRIEYDWEAASGNQLLLPIGGGVSKTVRLRNTPLKMDLELQNFVQSPDAFGPEWLLRFTLTPAFRSPFGR